MVRYLFAIVAIAGLVACEHTEMADTNKTVATNTTTTKAANVDHSAQLAQALAARPDDMKARYRYRNPQATLEYFGILPGQTVVEALPGAGWYSQILVDYLGANGHLIGVDYELAMYPKFGFFPDTFIEEKKTWVTDWVADAQQWRDADSAKVSAFVFGSMPAKYNGSADAVLMIRALHNLNRFESDGGFRTRALRDVYNVLKPGGTLGVVQHQAPDGMSDDWADGSRGYLKKGNLIATLEAAGFEFLGETGINHNHHDVPTEADIVWRLPPTLATSREDPDLREKMKAIGESNRMTLKFRKPI